MNKGLKLEIIRLILVVMLFVVILAILNFTAEDKEYIKQLEQNQIEQAEEKEVYRNRCKMLEDLMKENGLTLDECECR